MHYLAKHAPRKRRSIKARFAGIGVAGAATIAAGIATANEAKAAGSIWDTVAQCETGQNWATNSVPGYSGGLGFANRYWAAFGGTQYSRCPTRRPVSSRSPSPSGSWPPTARPRGPSVAPAPV